MISINPFPLRSKARILRDKSCCKRLGGLGIWSNLYIDSLYYSK